MAMHELRPMGIGDILDVAFRLYRRRFLTFLLISLIVYVPYALLVTVLPVPVPAAPASPDSPASASPAEAMMASQRAMAQGGGSRAGMIQPSQPGQADVAALRTNLFAAMVAWTIGSLVFGLLLLPLCGAAMTHNISASYLGEDLSAWASYARALPRLPRLLGTQMLAGLIIGLGLMLLVVPGIYFYLWFFVVVPVVVIEGLGGTKALGRSRELMRDNIVKGFLLGLVLFILSWIIQKLFEYVGDMIPWPHPMAKNVLGVLLNALMLPIWTAATVLLYYDLRIRKEAFDLQQLAETLGQPAANQAVPA
jgi:hypothetical protein